MHIKSQHQGKPPEGTKLYNKFITEFKKNLLEKRGRKPIINKNYENLKNNFDAKSQQTKMSSNSRQLDTKTN